MVFVKLVEYIKKLFCIHKIFIFVKTMQLKLNLMKKNLLSVIFLAMTALSVCAVAPKSEVRAVWLTTNGGSDWPTGSYTESAQKQKLTAILDRLEDANFNTIVLQVQVMGDVIWDSAIQPALVSFTGNASKSLSWNICDYVIDECHKRNMECHAWIVPYRLGTNKYSSNKIKHVSELHPELCVSYNNAWYLDPGLPEVRSYLLDLYREMLTKHKFDGTNFDYTRYPDKSFDDSKSYAKYGNGKSLGDWRRENINTFVHEFYDMAKSINPDVKVGAAPIGTYKNVNGTGNMSAYEDVYQDACEWMQAGKQDLLIPQMYWNEKYGFSTHLTTWVDNSANRQLIIGLAPYKMDDSNNWDYTVVTDQIEKIRAKGDKTAGVCFFRTNHVIGTTAKQQQLYAALKDDYFKYPAHIVPMVYNGVTKPNKPENAEKNYDNGIYKIKWSTPALDAPNTPIKYYSIYASPTLPIDINDPANCIAFAVEGNTFEYKSSIPDMKFAVTTFDKNNYESDAAMDIPTSVDNIAENSFSFINSDGLINITSGIEIVDITVYASTGAVAKSIAVNDIVAEVSCKDLESGIYMIKVKFADSSVSIHKILR